MKKSLDELLAIRGDQLLENMKATYQQQKLSKVQNIIARGLEMIVYLCWIIGADGVIYKGIGVLAFLYALYRIFRPHGDDSDYYNNFETIVEGMGNLKKYKDGEIKVDIDEKKIKRLEKNIVHQLPNLITQTTSNKMFRIIALVPIINVLADEMTQYRDSKGALHLLVKGNIIAAGLEDFTNKALNLTTDTKKENTEENR